jgi:hypothetical protein
MSRVFGLMKQGLPVCEPSLLKTAEREAYVDFSGWKSCCHITWWCGPIVQPVWLHTGMPVARWTLPG